MKKISQHVSWLQLIDVVGPFIAVEQLDEIFPQGLDAVYPEDKKRVRSAYEEWCDACDSQDEYLDKLHAEWLRLVMQDFLGYADEDLAQVDSASPSVSFTDDLTGAVFAPDFILHGSDATEFMFIKTLPPLSGDRKQPAFPIDEMTSLCRARGVRLGLVTNGEQWTLVHAPESEMSSAVSWYARFWFQEPQTLRAFSSLLGVRRFFGPESERLPALLDKAGEHRQTITDALGNQVRSAVEVLIQCLDRADADRNRELLRDVSPATLYEACLTVMMRLVFILCAEERGLLLLGDPVYDEYYAVTRLRESLAEMGDLHGEQVLERRHDAWARIIAVFRAIYFGIEHEDMRLPALGGSLFDPEKYPFLEGRKKPLAGHAADPVTPLPIDNRTVLLLLTSLQVVEQKGGALVQSYRALDVEQIGYIYEGLLEHTACKTEDVVLGLKGSDKAKEPFAELSALESLAFEGEDKLVAFLKERTGRSAAALARALKECDNDFTLPLDDRAIKRLVPFSGLLRNDAWGRPAVYAKGSFMVTMGTDRRSSGTHYTPKALTERIVKSALEPVVYSGPAEGKPRSEWKLKSPNEILALKVCDPAMGSGAFLVQACRYLADRLIESLDRPFSSDPDSGAAPTDGLITSSTPAERLAEARRLISEKCLYGVDVNPMAVELAKLSLWLVTISKGRPFGYLDHNLRSGDSLLGVHDVRQLTELKLKPTGVPSDLIFMQHIDKIVNSAIADRMKLRNVNIIDIRDVEEMKRLDEATRSKLEKVECFADLFCGTALSTKGNDKKVAKAIEALDVEAMNLFGRLAQSGDAPPLVTLTQGDFFKPVQPALPPVEADYTAEVIRLLGNRRPFHWAIEFPEVFSEGGFDAICGNPPFLGGKRLTGAFGTDYRDYLVRSIANGVTGEGGAGADFVAYFFLRAYQLLKRDGVFGLIATNTIAEGATRQVGLEQLCKSDATIIEACPDMPWPGVAGVVISPVFVYKNASWNGARYINNELVECISPYLSDQNEWSPKKLKANNNQSFIGCVPYNQGFVLSEQEAQSFLSKGKSSNAIYPYLIGEDMNSSPTQVSSKWIINFWDWPLDRDEKGTWCTTNDNREVFLKSFHVPKDYPGPVASDFEELLKVVSDKVKPERETHSEKLTRAKWWCFQRVRSELYHVSGRGAIFASHPNGWRNDIPLKALYGTTLTSKHRAFFKVNSDVIIDQSIVVIVSDLPCILPILNSAFHVLWAFNQGCTLGSGPRYTPSTCYETFPFPEMFSPASFRNTSYLRTIAESSAAVISSSPTTTDHSPLTTDQSPITALERLGAEYDAVRREIMTDDGIGLTKLYNAFHDEGNVDERIVRMRELQVKIDLAVRDAYGWVDVDLAHGFHAVSYLPANDNIRFTISEPARLEILRRLSRLNHERWESEQVAAKKK